MMIMRKILRGARLAAALIAALAIAACASQNADDTAGQRRWRRAPGSQQDFVVNVGDRVFFETDSTDLTPQSRAHARQAGAVAARIYAQYTFTIEGHADERGTREYNIALGARRAQTVRDYLASRGIAAEPHAHHLLRQGAAGRGLQRHLLLVAEPPRGHGAQREFVSRLWIRRPGTLGA